MPQETNLNVAPYFDDFDPQSNYYKVLFKPAYPVQARELNNLQSILQNQIEDMGTHFFKEGAKVIPGQLTFLPNFYAIQIEPEFLGVPVSLYVQQLVGKRITGATSGVTAEVVTYITDQQSDRGVYTLYLDYHESSTSDNATQTLLDNEVLLTGDNITFATTFIAAGEGFAKTLTENANAVGSAFALSNGVYFLRGFFVDVEDQILILDQYGNKPNYRIGLNVTESLISSDVDPSLNDNAKNFTNFTAPGADRLEITAFLAKKERTDFNDQNFVQLAEVQNGILRETNTATDYNILGDELATRTFDESGHYYVKEFVSTVKESLNDGFGNRGVYNQNQTTSSGKTPSDDLMVYKIGPGKAYVRGYPIETLGPTFLDAPKARTTRKLTNQSVNFGFGPSFQVNNVKGAPTLGFDSTNTISLRSQRIGAAATDKHGEEIGIARVYDFALESGSYNAANLQLNQWDLSLFDVQTYTKLDVNENIDLTTPVHVKGESSGAEGFIRYNVTAGTAVTVYDVKGGFNIGERLTFNGQATDARTVLDVTNHEISDVQSVYSVVGSAGTFVADLIPQDAFTIGIASITKLDSATGVSTISNPTLSFPGIVTTGNLVRYSLATDDFPTLNRVTQVNTNTVQIQAIQDVASFINGGLPTTDTSVTNLSVVESKPAPTARNSNIADNESLFSIFPRKTINSVDLTQSNLIIRRQFDVTVTDGSTGSINADANEVFLPYDEERYCLVNDAGNIQVLSEDRFTFSAGSGQITINNLTDNGPAKLIATLRKSSVTPKIKQRNGVVEVVIDRSINPASGIGQSTLNDGLLYGTYPYGTRVQDRDISLNVPDAVIVYGIFLGDPESGANDPESPSMDLASMDGPTNTTNDLILGEEVIGSLSGARALYVARKTDTSMNFIYENRTSFAPGEVINFQQSGVSAVASNVVNNSRNVTKLFDFLTGQRKSHYDYSRIRRRENSPTPQGKLKVYCLTASYNNADTGDITVANSYIDFDYGGEINKVNNFRTTDIIDARPRVSSFPVATSNTRSPFEFLGRTFNGGQHSSRNILASDESITVSYDYYLPRIDRIYLDKNGIFQVIQGSPSDTATQPKGLSNAMNIANVFVPAYTFNVANVRTTFINHKRYQMSDISKLEQRIKSLEYYTSLNQLESRTLNQFIPDANGLNRFRSGLFVDNFSSLLTQELRIGAKNAIDRGQGILRPSHYTTAVNMEIGNTTMAGIGTTTASNQDVRFADILGQGVRRSGQMITLDFTETSWLRQPFATRSESVTPFLVRFWEGSIRFQPSVDVWIDVNRMELRDVLMEGSFQGVAEAMRAEITTDADGSRSGVSPVIWKAWETTGVNVSFDLSSSQNTVDNGSTWRQGTMEEFVDMRGAAPRPNVPGGFMVEESNTSTETTITGTVGVDLNQQRTGSQTTVTEQIDTSSLGDRIVSREVIQFMRARNIEFTAQAMKPFTEVYPFFDNVDVKQFCFSKLIEVQMRSGTFEVGEAIGGVMPDVQIFSPTDASVVSTSEDENISPAIVFRLATANHKFGPYNNPRDTYDRNPYDRENLLPDTYTETSTVLNVDTFSLASDNSPEFQGHIATGMRLVGANSGAEATVTNVRLITDRIGTLIGSYRVPSSDDPSTPVFETGRSVLRLTSSETNSRVEGLVSTSAEDIFYSQGDQDNTQEVTLSLRNARVTHDDSFVETRTIGDSASASTTFDTGGGDNGRLTGEFRDPLAQSFIVDDVTGVYLSSIDIYFQERPLEFDVPVTLQIREVELGIPNQRVLPFSEVQLSPDDITTSNDASIPTKFTFESPVYLNGQREYAIILLSNSTEYRVWISRLGESDVATLNREAGQILVSTQRLLGSLFKSQNASTWTPSQYEDLTFEMFRADFVPSGSVQFFNPELPQDLEVIPPNGIVAESKTIRVGLGTTVADANLLDGQTVIQTQTGATGKFVGYGGSASQMSLGIINPGIGFTPTSGHFTFTGVAMTSITGHGINATTDIHIENGVATGCTIVNGGRGYQVGDILSPVIIGTGLGEGIRVSISTIFGNNELNLTNVQGEFSTGGTAVLNYRNAVGVVTTLDVTRNPTGVTINGPISVVNDGLHMTVNQRNHGMYSNTNRVMIRGVGSNVPATSLTVAYPNTATGDISVGNTAHFTTFESIGVAVTNPGYITIGDEIISYTGLSGNVLTGVTRGIDNTNAGNHDENQRVSKYEFNGVSLRRINKAHNLNEVTASNPYDADFYKIKINMAENGANRASGGLAKAFFATDASGGGPNARGTYNIPFSQVIPNFNTVTPTGTNIAPTMRTISATSISGEEGSFVDEGFEQISLNQTNYFDSMRMISSRINEQTFLDELPGNKSLTVGLNMTTDDTRITPGVDLDQVAMVLTSNRVNNPVSNYATDFRVNTITEDPNKFFYVTKNITLENPGTSIQVYLDAYLAEAAELRCFYAFGASNLDEAVFVPFPGTNNFRPNGSVLSFPNSDGTTDVSTPKTDDHNPLAPFSLYRELKWSVDDLSPFSSFRIKLVGTTTNQAHPPYVKNFRAIGLA